jgi:hypothetical protein
MKQSINDWDFTDAFHKAGRGKQFSYDGLKALFEYLEEYEEGTGEEINLDVIALCCEYAEYDSLKEYNDAYDTKYSEIDLIQDDTTLIKIEGSERFIIQQY